ncbi:MAG TPA: hypothetical protein VGW36_07505 [Pyrinomonadaceae bacterium]|nr:hypothetical protein [Pyrinomonadaceae bacterium]
MSEPIPVEKKPLYQSTWWTRLAAFSENREDAARAKVSRRKKERSSFKRTLASLLPTNNESSLTRIFN